ncbi:unnamed protein product [Rotaria socialis]|uniref:Peptidase S1 domain-containing protein n=1 Tax=Rotaria socialis TaxID=392032 RepID=A0A820YMI5_9BILA|nr:unnamed protein product [Rotaria socialis]CAF4550186.1 unnamed protein product [Rotaria socialis]CAF4705690.1 unnamed protein product [Rotaria socialis]
MAVRSNTYNPPTITNTFTLKLSIILSISIALLLTIGKSKCDDDASNFNHAEPCDCGCQAISSQITPRIVNVVFHLNGQPSFYWSVSLITPQHALTGAHCILGSSSRYVGVISGLQVFNISTWPPSTAHMAQHDNVSLLCIVPENRGQQELKKGESLIHFTISKITICITRTSIMCADFPPTAICFADSGGPLVQLTAHSNRKTY